MGTTNLDSLELGGDLTVAGNEVITGGTQYAGAVTLGDTSADAITINGTTIANAPLTVNGATLIAVKDNASSFRIKGLQAPSEGVAQVQNYAGIFYDDGYLNWGTLKTRAAWGGNLEMDVQIQSPHALILSANDGTQTDCVVKVLSQTNNILASRVDSEVTLTKYLVADRVDTSTKGAANTSDVTLSSNSGSIYLNYGSTSGVPVAPNMTNAQIAALGAVNGGFAYDTTNNKFMVCEGGTWTNVI